MSDNTIEVKLYDYDEQGSCLADVSLSENGLLINQLQVKQGLGGGIIVHMPKWMRGRWSFPEISWSSIRQVVVEKYRSSPHAAHKLNSSLIVHLHSFDEKNNCLADVSVPTKELTIRNLKVQRAKQGGIMVHMPGGAYHCWDVPDISWTFVRQTVTAKYHATLERRTKSGGQLDQWVAPQAVTIPQFHFHSCRIMYEAELNLQLCDINKEITGIQIRGYSINAISIRFPFPSGEPWPYPEVIRQSIFDYLNNSFARAFLNADITTGPENYIIHYTHIQQSFQCLVDLSLPGRKLLKSFRLQELENGNIYFNTPPKIGEWKDPQYPWHMLRKMVKSAYLEQKAFLHEEATRSIYRRQPDAEANDSSKTANEIVNAGPPTDERNINAPASHPPRPKNEYGRLYNAENSAFRFYPHTVLRRVENSQSGNVKSHNRLTNLAIAMSKGEQGGIGPFALSILEWVSRLRYVNKAMLTDLVKGGFINKGWRTKIDQNTIDTVIKRMASYDLIVPTQFVAVDDGGNPLDEKDGRAMMWILTLGSSGNSLLHELGSIDSRFNAFDVYRDGNSVKRYLSANQFLIYWLTHYPNLIGDNYYTAIPVFWRGTDYVGAWFYATVSLGEHVLVGESIRRVEDFERLHHRVEVRDKLERVINILSHPEQLYTGQYKTEEISFMSRPILVLICEDDEHVLHVREMLEDIIDQHPEQEVWFTTDLRIYNTNMKGHRFITIENEQIILIDICTRLNLSDSY